MRKTVRPILKTTLGHGGEMMTVRAADEPTYQFISENPDGTWDIEVPDEKTK
jgi:hypothetical protein